MKELIDDLRELAGVQCWASDHLSNAADALESQAREIERLRLNIAEYNEHERCYQSEIAALKAQPSGVVLSNEELWSIRNHVAINEVLCEDDSMEICVKHGRAIEQAVIARLNQPASAGDERAAFDAWFCKRHSYKPGTDTTQLSAAFEPFKAWQARAALLANHGEQVPYGWKLVPFESTGFMEDAAGIGMEKAREVYRAMLAAAPSAGSQGGDV